MRSIWRETKFIKLLLIAGIKNLSDNFNLCIENLVIEKRRKRLLQMTSPFLS